jgi:hypothetical protein
MAGASSCEDDMEPHEEQRTIDKTAEKIKNSLILMGVVFTLTVQKDLSIETVPANPTSHEINRRFHSLASEGPFA